MEQSSPPTLAVLTDGHAGNLRQAMALAGALGDGDPACVTLHPSGFARRLAPRRWPLVRTSLGSGFASLLAAPPRMAVGCGRQGALATRLLREGGSRVVQILDPRIDPRHWDVVIVPEHDRLRGENVLTLLGSLHPVDDIWLAQARHDAPALGALPSPRTVVLVGGPTRHAALADADFTHLLARLQAQVLAEGGSLCVLASRRTPEAWKAAMAGIDAAVPGLRWRDARDGANPYAGLLAWAQRIVCTPDSINMLSEAAATQAQLQVWQPQALRGRLRGFLETLHTRGRLQHVGEAWDSAGVVPLRETARIAAEVMRRLG